MANRKPLIKTNGRVRELTVKDMEKFKPAAEVLPASLSEKLGLRDSQSAGTKLLPKSPYPPRGLPSGRRRD